MATTTSSNEQYPEPPSLLRPLLHWLNSLPAAGPRCLLAADAADVIADGGRALCDLIGLLLLRRAPPSAGLTLAQALEALARRRPQAFERHLLPSLVAADPRAAAWGSAELAARVLRDGEGSGGGGDRGGGLLLPALLWGLRRMVEEKEVVGTGRGGTAAAPLGALPLPPPPAAAAAAVISAAAATASRSTPTSPCQRLRPGYHRHVAPPEVNSFEGAGDDVARSPARRHTPSPQAPARQRQQQRQRRLQRQEQQEQDPLSPPLPPPPQRATTTITTAEKRAAVRTWLAALGLLPWALPPPQQEPASSWGEGDPLRDGRLLCRLFVALEPAIAAHTKGLQRILERAPRTRQEAAETVACALWLFRCRCSPPISGGRFDDVDGVLGGKASRTWGLLWELMQLYAPPAFSSSAALLLSSSSASAAAAIPAPCWRAPRDSSSSSPTRHHRQQQPERQQQQQQYYLEEEDDEEEGQMPLRLEASLASWLGAVVGGEAVPSLPACEAALRDGTLLCQLAGRAVGREIVGWYTAPRSRDACLVNLTKAVEALRTWPAPMGRRFLYPGVEEDIYGGDWEATVGLLEDVHRALDGIVPPRPPIPSPREGHYLGRSLGSSWGGGHAPPALPSPSITNTKKKATATAPPPHAHALLDLYPEQEEGEEGEEEEEGRPAPASTAATAGVSPLPSSPSSPLSAFGGGGGRAASKGREQQLLLWELLEWLAARGVVVVEDPHALAAEFADGILLARLVAGLLAPDGEEEDEEAAAARRDLEAAAADAEEGEALMAVVPRLKRIKQALRALRRLRRTGGGAVVAAALPLHLLHREIDVLEGRSDAIVPLLLGVKRVYDARAE